MPFSPCMFHRFIIPCSEQFLRTRDTASVGIISNLCNVITDYGSARTSPTFFCKFPAALVGEKSELKKLQYETILLNCSGHWRYPADWGTNKCPNFVFDVVSYLDLLQLDLGLAPYWEKGLIVEAYLLYGPEDH
ncbi:flavin-binding monooxygenase-like protein [Colletotrichum tofieldiae]|uniref:Flavin-binding monooxygenase-like protein n=1 Tax=Colletotrichum tofieldiae TaxID=708197 RepID=A0A166XPM9_9PEZI|nr:flavin-binding monooxygenase-like protein [Colletotrichum tofieldiae]